MDNLSSKNIVRPLGIVGIYEDYKGTELRVTKNAESRIIKKFTIKH